MSIEEMEKEYDDLTKKIDFLSEKMYNCSKIGDKDNCGEIMKKRNVLIEKRTILNDQIKKERKRLGVR
jgi:hypothetical protein